MTKVLKKSDLYKNNKLLSDFIDESSNNFSRKKKMMKILYDLSNQLNKENNILKNSNEEKISNSSYDKKNEKEKIKDKKEELNLSIIKEQQQDENEEEMLNAEKKNNLEISVVQLGKLAEKEKNVLEIEKLINLCEQDIEKIKKAKYKYKNSSENLFMESGIFNDKSMIFINKKEKNEDNIDDSEKKINYFNGLNSEYCSLKKKLENLLSMYKTEKDLTETKKTELEKLENLKAKYNKIKQRKI